MESTVDNYEERIKTLYVYIYIYMFVGELLMSFQVLRMYNSCPPELVFPPHFLKIFIEVKVSGPQHVLRLVGVSRGMLPVKWDASFVSIIFNGDHKTV